MKLVIFGASGATGQELVKQGIAAGHRITAFVRAKSNVSALQGAAIRIGDVYQREDVLEAIRGEDAVLSALGARTLGKSDLLEASTSNIIWAMQQTGVRRLIVLGAAGAKGIQALADQPGSTKLFFRIIQGTFLKWPFRSQRAMHRLVEGSNLDWTIVEPPRLLNGGRTGKYRVSPDTMPANSSHINRADVAEFMLAQLESRQWIGKTPYIAD